ncbi:MAG: A/G-specific adenine glycosylase [Limnohabitans sp.]
MPKALTPSTDTFAHELVRWQRQHGRHDLPWQRTRDPYRVWLSEVMLQQTQVSTVMGYYDRFLARYPQVAALAAAPLDDVMALWSGLGYYSRARNLHRCAQAVVAQHGGEFPRHAHVLQTLPGIGRSTAAAIASLCFEERIAILDGNVKRVLTRVLAFEQDLAKSAAEKALWALAQSMLPEHGRDMPAYTQGVMDLGATVCTRTQPRCPACPVRPLCQAHQRNETDRFPIKTRTLRRSSQSWWWLLAVNPRGEVMLVKRPQQGIWAGLHCLPMWQEQAALLSLLPATAQRQVQHLPVQLHALTHRDLHLHTVVAPLGQRQADAITRAVQGNWYGPEAWDGLGLPAPVRNLLTQRTWHPIPGDGAV